MNFERTQDHILVKWIITNPKVWPYVTDDAAPAIEDFEPTMHPAIWYVIAKDGEETLGMWSFIPHNSVSWEVHTFLLPRHGFRRARVAAREMAQWIWDQTSCRRIWTHVPKCNCIALAFAKAAGMIEFGVNPASFLKGGRLWDQVLLGISKEN